MGPSICLHRGKMVGGKEIGEGVERQELNPPTENHSSLPLLTHLNRSPIGQVSQKGSISKL